MLQAARQVDQFGHEYLFTWDHLYAPFGDPDQPIFEGWSLLSAWARETTRARLGLWVGANTFRNPGLVAKMATTLDHLSNGRAVTSLGGAWFRLEHDAHALDFGSGFGERLNWLDESVGAIRALLDGKAVTSTESDHYRFQDLRHAPLPVQSKLPIMIGGAGEKKTLRTVARYADMWNTSASPEVIAHKVDVLRRHCDEVGRDPAEIEFMLGVQLTIRDTAEEAERVWRDAVEHNRKPVSEAAKDEAFWNGNPEQIAERFRPYLELGFRSLISEQPAPYDLETIERFASEVRPLLTGTRISAQP